ncbi:MAG TPA: ASKHA domain-containing protein [Terracidiphilus sp.]|nr:ASKHA domain-containing protein [Terracidiphilus sp.]
MSTRSVAIRLEPLAIEIAAPQGASLASVLAGHGVEFPCGGTGVCGSCGVRVIGGSLPVTEIDRSVYSEEQLAQGWRLACQARAESSLVLECGQWHMDVLTDSARISGAAKHGLGVAIDLGTTTIAAQMLEMSSGNVLAVETELNPQTAFGSDVMSRIRAVLHGADLTAPIRAALGHMVVKLAHGREEEISEVVLVGNTVMHHLFSGRSVEPLAHTPFASPHLDEQRFSPRELGWALPDDCTIRFAPCPGGFVGSDILAGMVATGMTQSDELFALIDLGTNGEIAIGNRHGVVCASTAAGPAFEAGSIRMGMRAGTGAISHVALRGKAMEATVIGGVEPRGICGSGIVDAVAAGLRSGAILASGRIADGTKVLPVAGIVALWQSDVRELQLAKGAIAAGFRLLLRHAGAESSDLNAIHLAGAFGNYVRIESAIEIGLIEAPRELVHAAGNTALRGAKMLLLSEAELQQPPVEHANLAAIGDFQREFADCMAFPEAAISGRRA